MAEMRWDWLLGAVGFEGVWALYQHPLVEC